MENTQGSSFIPKSPVHSTTKPRGRRKVFVFAYVSFIFFFGVLIATGVIFAWNIAINNQLESKKIQLSDERNSFNQADLVRIRELDARMQTAFSMLDKHVSVRRIFDVLEQTTLQSVQLMGFEYKKDSFGDAQLALVIKTNDFNSSLFQRSVFEGNSILSNASITNFSFTGERQEFEDGTDALTEEVLYTLTKTVSSNDIPYVVNQTYEEVEEVFTDEFIDTKKTQVEDTGVDTFDSDFIEDAEVIE